MEALLLGLLAGLAVLLAVGHRHACADWGNVWLNSLCGVNRLYCRWVHGLDGRMLPLPEQGGVLVAANHISGVDPQLLVASSSRPLRFMIARDQYQRFGLTWLFRAMRCIPVDRGGRPELAFYGALRALERGEAIVVFPQGGIRPRGKLKRGVVKLASLADVPVIPVHVSGVGAPGSVALAVVVPSKARLQVYEPISVDDGDEDAALAALTSRLIQEPLADAGQGDEKPAQDRRADP